MRFLSVCSGIEAASVAWEPLGWKAVGFSEIEPFPCAVLAHRFPNTPNYGSLTEYQKWPVGPGTADVLVGGCPCQSFSVAGLRRGMQDPRGNLTLTYLGLADKVKPKWIVYENVPGLLSSNGGRDFGAFLGALVQLGYGFAYRVLDAQHVGRCGMHAQGSGWDAVPQRRRRVFVVACLGAGGWESAAKVLFEPESLSGDTAKGRKKGQGVASDAQGGAGASGLPDTVGTLCADTHPGAYTGQDAYTGRLIPASKPLDESKPIVIDRAAFNQGENAQFDPHIEQTDVMDPLVARGPHAVACATGDITHCLTASSGKGATEDGTGRGAPIVNAIPIQDGREIEKRQNGIGIGQPGDPAYTIDTTGAQAAGVPFRESKRAQSTTDDESWVEAGEANTLNNFDLGDTRTTHAVVSPTITTCKGSRGGSSSKAIDEITAIHLAQASVAPTVTSSGPPYSRTGNERVEAEALAVTTIFSFDSLASNSMKSANPNSGCREVDLAKTIDTTNPCPSKNQGGLGILQTPPMAVRRLTPTECMRLQGFPDDWARIPWKGKPADQCPDGPQYKAAGNSMAVPVMRWIGSRISAVEQLSNPQA